MNLRSLNQKIETWKKIPQPILSRRDILGDNRVRLAISGAIMEGPRKKVVWSYSHIVVLSSKGGSTVIQPLQEVLEDIVAICEFPNGNCQEIKSRTRGNVVRVELMLPNYLVIDAYIRPYPR